MLSCASADRLQIGMRGAFGKSLGTVACVNIGQVIMSARVKGQHKA
jgi:large subunit ribosomal protein L10e